MGIAYAAPTAVIVTVFFLVPLAVVFWMSMNRWRILGSPEFNFPDNYTKIPDNQLFLDSVTFTLKYTAIVTDRAVGRSRWRWRCSVQHPRPGVGFFRMAYFLPGAVGFAAASLLFYGFYSQSSPLDSLLQSLGILDEPVNWLGTPNMALFSTISMVIWRFAGFNMLILLTGLQSIPTDVYEAARSDGASRWQMFRYITVPLLRPTIALMLVLSITGSLLAFDQFFILTRGGPDGSTVSMVMVIYPRGVHALRPRLGGGDLGAAADRAGGAERPSAARPREGAMRPSRAGHAGYYTTSAALAVLFLLPLLWSGYSSFEGEAGSGQESGFGFGNYTRMADYGEGLWTYLFNTAAVSLMTVAGTLFVSALGGYAFARFRFPGKNLLFLATLAILMVPYATILIPLYVVLGHLGLQNSLVGLSLVLIMFQLPFAIFMMRNSFEAIPRELEEAALVDGCTTFSALRRILLRAVRPG